MILYTDRVVALRCSMIATLLIGLLEVPPGSAPAADTYTQANGNWNSAATWTNGVPGPDDRAFIGCGTMPLAATVTLTQNSSAAQVYLSSGGGTSGTLDLNGFTLSTNFLAFGDSPAGAASILRTGGGLLSIGDLNMDLGSLSLLPGDVTAELDVYNLATAVIAVTSNVTSSVRMNGLPAGGGTLALQADLDLSGQLNIAVSGTLNANGHAISTQSVFIRNFTGSAFFQNEGVLTTGSWMQELGSQFQIRHPGDTLGSLLISGSSALMIDDAAGQTTGLTVGATDISIDSSSHLSLQVNGQASGWVFRWANPSGGDHIADMQSLINANEITFSYLNGGSYTLSADSSYTYVNVVPVPEPSSLLLSLAAAGGLALRVRNNRKK